MGKKHRQREAAAAGVPAKRWSVERPFGPETFMAAAVYPSPAEIEEAKAAVEDPGQAAREEFERLWPAAGVSLKKDPDGFFVTTHRARSKSYPTVADIPKSAVDFIDSTG